MYDRPYSKLTDEEVDKLILGKVISSRFMTIPLEIDEDYIDAYRKLVSDPPEYSELDISMKILIGIMGVVISIYSIWKHDFVGIFWGIDLIVMAITGRGIIDNVVMLIADSVDAEDLKTFSIWNLFAWSNSPVAKILNIGWGILLTFGINKGLRSLQNKIFPAATEQITSPIDFADFDDYANAFRAEVERGIRTWGSIGHPFHPVSPIFQIARPRLFSWLVFTKTVGDVGQRMIIPHIWRYIAVQYLISAIETFIWSMFYVGGFMGLMTGLFSGRLDSYYMSSLNSFYY